MDRLVVALAILLLVSCSSSPEVPTPTVAPTIAPTTTATSTLVPTATATLMPTPTPTLHPVDVNWALENYGPPWVLNCEDGERWNGFTYLNICVPGIITKESQFFESPRAHYGMMTSYAAGVMEAQVAYRGWDPSVEGVALMSCAEIGKTVYLNVEGQEKWWGPFRVADCSGHNHLYYHMVEMGLAVEVSYKMAKEMGALRFPRVNVCIECQDPNGVNLAHYWLENVLEWEQ